MVRSCLDKLNELGKSNTVSLLWIPGHAGEQGNEMADELARKGAAAPFIGPEPFCGISPQAFRAELRQEEERNRANLWKSLPGLRQSKISLGNFNRKRSKEYLRLSKNRLRIITGFLTGHCKLNGHLYKMKLKASNECRFCQDKEETPLHILTECEPLGLKRLLYLGKHQLEEREIPSLKPQLILHFIEGLGLGGVL